MSIGLIVLIALIVLLVAGMPTWGYSRGYGWGPSGIISIVVVVLLILLLLGKI